MRLPGFAMHNNLGFFEGQCRNLEHETYNISILATYAIKIFLERVKQAVLVGQGSKRRYRENVASCEVTMHIRTEQKVIKGIL